ncbi:helix-turn-helix transcriptional regulator [Streptomyces sulphureus]|uniref:helix-turn-helix transcriptional regulator n=1 Tax=Streptomyces sulphureus TaxID=47758 RepID=UPI00039FC371|nr:LuxR family transcriptional regulator [Streptomyces sulphureus]
MLVDRDLEVSQLMEMLTDSTRGKGTLAVVRGGTATGKTELLHTLCEHATGKGFRVLNAIASTMEHSFPFALIEQLFPGTAKTAEEDRTSVGEAAKADLSPDVGSDVRVPPQSLRFVHSAAQALTEEGPLLLAVDDVQHGDAASLQCLLYLVRRLRTMPIALVATETPHSARNQALLGELQYHPHGRRLRLAPLTRSGAGRLLSEALGAEAAERLRDPFLDVSGGNPLLLHALIRDSTSQAGTEPESCELVVSDAFEQAALACVHRSGPEYVRVARGLAVLDGHGGTALLADLLHIDPQTAERTVDGLEEAGLLDGARFRHPALRSAVLSSIPALDHAALQQRATRLLHEEGAPCAIVAAQLLECGPLGEEWEAPLLRSAAEQHLADGEIAPAVRCLQLAGRSTTDEAQALACKFEVARLNWQFDPKSVTRQMQELTEPAQRGLLRPTTALDLIRSLLWHGMEDEAVKITGGGVPESGDDPRFADRLHATWLSLASTYPGALSRMGGPLSPRMPDEPCQVPETESSHLIAERALHSALTSGDAEDVAAAAEQGLPYVHPGRSGLEPALAALHALVYVDRLDLADSWCDQLLNQSPQHRPPAHEAVLLATKALVLLRTGNLPSARDNAYAALSRFPAEGWGTGLALPLAVLVEAHACIGEHEAAAELLSRPLPDNTPQTRFGMQYQYARGYHHLVRQQYQAALACFVSCGEQLQTWCLDSPGFLPWRSGAAEAWLGLHEPAPAVRLLNEQIELSEPRHPRAAGAALRCLAATRPPSHRTALLERALERSQAGGDSYNTVRILVDLGRSQQELGMGTAARQVVRRAWRLAQECGAQELARALRPAFPYGGREKRIHESLTEAERRVASLAARGHTNREVAAKLFVTVSTVEQHLTKVYRKFRIKHRNQLPASLTFDGAMEKV